MSTGLPYDDSIAFDYDPEAPGAPTLQRRSLLGPDEIGHARELLAERGATVTGVAKALDVITQTIYQHLLGLPADGLTGRPPVRERRRPPQQRRRPPPSARAGEVGGRAVRQYIPRPASPCAGMAAAPPTHLARPATHRASGPASAAVAGALRSAEVSQAGAHAGIRRRPDGRRCRPDARSSSTGQGPAGS